MKITGIDALQRKLKEMSKAAERLDGSHNVSVSELFPDEFMRHNTRFASMQTMTDEANIESEEDLETQAWLTFVTNNTNFATWDDMKSAAGGEWAKSQLGF